MGMFNGKKGTYLVVWHEYWMTSKKWDHEILAGVSKKAAATHGALIADERRNHFNYVDYHVIKLPDEIHVVNRTAKE